MSHMVIYRTTDGQPGYHQTEVLDDAVAFVERLRNADGVDEARIFRMDEVEFDFKPYFRVEVGNEALPSRAAAPMASPTPPPPPAVAVAAPAPPEERGWMDLPVIDEPAPSMARADRSPMAAPLMAEPPLMPEASPFGHHEVGADPAVEIPPPPPPPPVIETDDSVGSGNGMGARRGLFGR